MGDHRMGVWALGRVATIAALCVVIALIVLRVSASVNAPASGVVVADAGGSTVVASVPIGSPAWLAGVRVGMPYHPWPDGDGGYVDTGTLEVGIAATYGTWPWLGPIAATVLLIGSVVLLWLLPTAGALGLVLTTGLVTNDLLGLVTAPMAWFVLLVPLLALASMWRFLGPAPRWLLAGLAMVCGAIVLLAIVDPDAIAWSTSWWLVATVPALAAIVIVSARLAAIAVRVVGQRRFDQPMSALLVRQTAAGRQAVMLAEESTRDRLAHWLHDRVMPPLAQARTNPDAVVALAEDLRSDVDREQLVILEWGGLEAALEGAGRTVTGHGLDWTLAIQELGGDPPWAVQVATWRVAQEAIWNAVQHASAAGVLVQGQIGSKRVVLSIADDGVGLDAETQALARASGHIGVVSMLRRARDVGATLAILPNRPSGTLVEFRWAK